MKCVSKAFIAFFLAVVMAMLLPAQVFADTPDYISEIKIGMGKTSEEAKAKCSKVFKSNLRFGAIRHQVIKFYDKQFIEYTFNSKERVYYENNSLPAEKRRTTDPI